MRITEDGKVGIGSNDPDGTLDVMAADGYAYFTTTSPAAFNMIFRSGSDDPQNNWLGQIEFTGNTSAKSQIVTRNSTTLALGSNNVQTLYITDDDNVGIGVSAPSSSLHVSSTASTELLLSDSNAGSNIKHYGINVDSGLMSFRRLTDTFSGYTATITFRSGSVGFGTTEPGLVNGTDRTGGGDFGQIHLKGAVPRILLDDDGDTPQFAITAQDFFTIDNIPDDSSSEGQLIRLNMSSDSPEIRTVVSASGTSYLTAPPIGAAGSENYTNYVMRRNRGTGINYEHNATSRDIRIIAGGNGVVLSGNGSSFSAISSDERKKQNWSNFVNASDKISTLTKIGQYQRLDPDTNDFPKGSDENGNQTILSGSEYGLSANEVQTILPHAVHTNKDGYLGLNYQDVFVLGIKAIQELTTEINTLKAQISGSSDFNNLKSVVSGSG
jgi:hypothetical protein